MVTGCYDSVTPGMGHLITGWYDSMTPGMGYLETGCYDSVTPGMGHLITGCYDSVTPGMGQSVRGHSDLLTTMLIPSWATVLHCKLRHLLSGPNHFSNTSKAINHKRTLIVDNDLDPMTWLAD